DARKRHRQKKNKTDSNQSSRKKKNSSSSRNIISNRQMTDLKRQKPTAEFPRSKRPPPEEVAFQNAPYKGGKCHIPFSTLATPSAVHVFVPSFPDASHIV
ncbi:TPA: hypothetical protein ACH911_004641, partial [Escherichia coli]